MNISGVDWRRRREAAPCQIGIRMLGVDADLLSATERGDIGQMRACLAAGGYVNCARGRLLRIVVYNGPAAAARLLLEHGADVNASDSGWTALHVAARDGRLEMLGLLLEAGANVEARWEGKTALYCTSWGAHDVYTIKSTRNCAKLLLSHGARAICGMWNAITRGRRDLVKIFLRAGARAIADEDMPLRCPANKSPYEVLDAVRAAGGWPEYAAAHRRVLAGLVAKLGAKGAVPLDAAGHVVAFYCPPGGF